MNKPLLLIIALLFASIFQDKAQAISHLKSNYENNLYTHFDHTQHYIASSSVDTIQNLKGFTISTDSIDAFLETRMDSLNIPGLSIAVINDAKVVYHRTMGYANLEKNTPVSKTTLFEGASLSKSVFAFFVMSFVEDGKLDLDKPLYEYLAFPDIEHDNRYKKITARIVLSHRSGFPNWRENEDDRKLKIKFDPDSTYEYSGEGYQYLAMVLKHIAKTDWAGLESLFQDRVAVVLGMENTTFLPSEFTQENKATPYNNSRVALDWRNDYWNLKNKGVFVAPSSIHTESTDFSKWMIAMMNKELLSENSFEELFKHHSLITTTSTGINVYYSLGFITADEPYNNTFFHGGSNAGFTCWYLMDIEKKWGYVVFTNSEYGEKLGDELWDYFERED